MNLTILLALVIAGVAIYILKKVIVHSIVRKAGRATAGTSQ